MKISVIIPTNRPGSLDLAKASLPRQSFQDFEILVGSPFDPSFGRWIIDDFKDGFWTLGRIYNRLIDAAKVALCHLAGYSSYRKLDGVSTERYYRNKLEFTFSASRYRTFEEITERDEKFTPEPALGFHAPGLFDKVVEIHTCYLQEEPTNILLNTIRTYAQARNLPYYDYKAQYGWLRNVILRIATTGEILINLVMHHEDRKRKSA